jgi:hypothetical protein
MKFQKSLFTAVTVIAGLYTANPTYAFQKTKDYNVVIVLTVKGESVIADKVKFKNLDKMDVDKLLRAYKDEFVDICSDGNCKLEAVAIPIIRN